jgi:hypothetical protein
MKGIQNLSKEIFKGVRSIPVRGCVPYIISQSLEVSKIKKNKKNFEKI